MEPADWLEADWPAPPRVLAGTTLRTGGASRGRWRSFNLGAHVGDDAAAVARNRARFTDRCGLPDEPAWLAQVHGKTVVTLPAAANGPPEADAAVTTEPGIVCAVLTADCLPVVLASADGGAVGVAHAGWRGLAAGVLESTVDALDAAPAEVLAWLGPAISQPAFEVGDEVREAFLAVDGAAARCFVANERGRWQADLYALARQRLKHAGVRHVYGGGYCTYRDAVRFFSYRRDGECGRMATFACLR